MPRQPTPRRAAVRLSIAGVACLGLTSGVASGQPIAKGDKPGGPVIKLMAGDVDTAAGKALTVHDVNAAKGAQRLLLQLDGPLTPARSAALRDAGVEVLDYVPDDAVIVGLKDADAAKAAGLEFVRWHSEFERAWKVDPNVGVRVFETLERRELSRRGLALLVVTLFKDADQAEITSATAAIAGLPGAEVHRRTVIADNPAIVATVRFNDIPRVDALPQVQWIEDAPEITDRDASANWVGQSNIPGAYTLWDKGLTGSGQILGVLDSSFDWNHCAFSDVNPIGPTHRKILAYNWRLAVTTFHGTHVAGLAVGDSGFADELRGVAYNAKMVFNTTPSFVESDGFERLELHHQQGARVHNNSWGENDISTYTGLVRGIDDFCWKYEDSLVLFATRNGPSGTTPVSRPENAKNVLAIGAVGDDPAQDNHCTGATGPTLDGRRKPDLFAPGCGLLSASANSGCFTTAATGTSMATPIVSGLGLLIRQYFSEGFYPSGTPSGAGFSPSSALLRAMLVNSGQDMLSFPGYPTNAEGWGRVNADRVLYFPGDTSRLSVVDLRNNAGLVTGGMRQHSIVVGPGSDPLRITLAWTEPAAAAGAASAPINNLDLEVEAPGGTKYLGNNFAGGQSAIGGSPDTLNNLEQVHVLSPAAGTWIVRVKATAVNVGPQGYAIVATGPVDPVAAPLQVAIPNPPMLLAPDVAQPVTVSVNAGDETIAPPGAVLMARVNGGSFSPLTLSPAGVNLFTADLPAAGCGDVVEYYLEATGSLSGTQTSPPGAPSQVWTAEVGNATASTLLSENFNAGLPAGWSVSGLWRVTDLCPTATAACEGGQWAYFGQVAGGNACTYIGSGRQQGNLTAPALNLPAIDPGERLVLRFCQSLERENFASVDLAQVLVNGLVVQTFTAATPAWMQREVDLSSYAGQSVTLAWRFDTIDGFANGFNGWRVDQVRVERLGVECVPPPVCQADFNGDDLVNGADLSILLANFNSSPATAQQGDTNGDQIVNGADLSVLLGLFNQACP